ncbi:MAG: ChbG/HpnK family deacetylase [Sedimentisphaerales bacterium]
MEHRLIINADDFGLCESVNKGIVEAHTKGVLTSTTIMTNMPAAEQAADLAKNLPTLGLGVHLNLTAGKPICQDNTVKLILDSQGYFALSPGKLALASLITGKVRTTIETELASQIQWLIDKRIKPTHLDSHKHIHSFPTIFPIVCRLAKRFGISAIRYTFEPKQVSQLPWPVTDRESRKRASLVRTMAKINRWQNPVFFKTDALLGVAHVGTINAAFMRAVSLYNIASTAELMTHPGYTYDLDVTRTRLVNQREVELEALCSEKTKQYLKDAGIKLIHYDQL